MVAVAAATGAAAAAAALQWDPVPCGGQMSCCVSVDLQLQLPWLPQMAVLVAQMRVLVLLASWRRQAHLAYGYGSMPVLTQQGEESTRC